MISWTCANHHSRSESGSYLAIGTVFDAAMFPFLLIGSRTDESIKIEKRVRFLESPFLLEEKNQWERII